MGWEAFLVGAKKGRALKDQSEWLPSKGTGTRRAQARRIWMHGVVGRTLNRRNETSKYEAVLPLRSTSHTIDGVPVFAARDSQDAVSVVVRETVGLVRFLPALGPDHAASTPGRLNMYRRGLLPFRIAAPDSALVTVVPVPHADRRPIGPWHLRGA